MSMRELRKLRPEVSDINHNGIAVPAAVCSGIGIATTALADALRVNGRGTVLADEPLGSLYKSRREPQISQASKSRCHFAVGLAIEQKAHVHAVYVGA